MEQQTATTDATIADKTASDQKSRRYPRLGCEAQIEALLDWHNWLHETENQPKGGRADRAALRRAQSPEDILMSSAFRHFLYHSNMNRQYCKDEYLLPAAIIACCLAHAKKHSKNGTFAGQLATPKEAGGKAPVSELRFSQLQKSRDYDEFFRRLVRALGLIDGTVNIPSLADSVLHWCTEHRCGVDRKPEKRLAVRWAKDYYEALNKFAA